MKKPNVGPDINPLRNLGKSGICVHFRPCQILKREREKDEAGLGNIF